ncbi:MAG: hypothetical protein ACR2JG_11895, partial [Geodermatophilaceae bacterium]
PRPLRALLGGSCCGVPQHERLSENCSGHHSPSRNRLLARVQLELLPGVVELGQQGAQVLARPGERVSAAGGEPGLLLTVDESLSSQVGQSVGKDLVAQRRQPGAELSKRARAVHQVAQQQGGPSPLIARSATSTGQFGSGRLVSPR